MRLSLGLFLCWSLAFVSSVQAATESGQHYRAVSTAGNVYELSIAAESLQTMQPLPVVVTVSTADGRPVSRAKLSCSLTMPAMAMPHNAPPLKESAEAGRYEGIFLLTMGGVWNVELSALHISGSRDAVVIEIVGKAPEQKGGKDIDRQLEELFQSQKKAN